MLLMLPTGYKQKHQYWESNKLTMTLVKNLSMMHEELISPLVKSDLH